MKLIRLVWLIVCATALQFAVSNAALGQAYPNRPVKLVVPFPAGSATDNVARVIGSHLQEALGQPFVIENKPGAQGVIAADGVAKSPPDGYTLLLTTNTQVAANVSLFKKLPYDPVKDFAPVARIGTTALVLMVRADFPAKNVPEFLAHVKSQPGKLSAGYGSSSSQVCIAMLRSLANVDVVSVPYKGIPLAVTDVLSGNLAFTFVDLGNALAQHKGGKMRALAFTADKRTPLAPDWPALAESVPGYAITAWFAIMAPAGTPNDVVQKLYDQTAKGVVKTDVQAKLATVGVAPAPMTPDELGRFIKTEIALWAKLVKEAGIEPE
ncbi:MAG TPA: tripartite tricarboxylate transporter substrate binding protein [Casimicrobiaceae bacterium]|nr:tripartite tricarboxylate transporter substrate binding protein [Casimicrobiaceae bacterium]